MKKVVEYCVVSSGNVATLQTQVNIKIKEGWQVQGSLSTVSHAGVITGFCQAMVKYED